MQICDMLNKNPAQIVALARALGYDAARAAEVIAAVRPLLCGETATAAALERVGAALLGPACGCKGGAAGDVPCAECVSAGRNFAAACGCNVERLPAPAACPADQNCDDKIMSPASGQAFPAYGRPGATTPASVPPASFNCRTYDDDKAACELERIRKVNATRTYAETFTDLAAATIPAAVLNKWGLDTPSDYTWIYLDIDPLGYSHEFRPTLFRVRGDPAGTPYDLPVSTVGVTSERIFYDGDGKIVLGLDDPGTATGADLEVTSSRCACKVLSTDTPAGAGQTVIMLIDTSTYNAGDDLAVEVTAERKRWGLCVGPCMPDKVCDHVLISDFT